MTDKVWITIKGIRTVDGEKEDVNESGSGNYYRRNEKHYIIWCYDSHRTKRIRFTKDSMSVAETNGSNAMEFKEGRETRTLYGTPGGNLPLTIRTHKFCLDQKENRIEAEVEYSLYYNSDHMMDNCIKVIVCSRQDD